MRLLSTIFAFLFLGSCFMASAQEGKVRRADKKFNNLEYIDAVTAYEAIVADGYESEDIFRKLGDAYYFNAEYAASAGHYQSLFKLNEQQSEEYLFRYGQSLKALKNYKKADTYLGEFYKMKGIAFSSSETFVESLRMQPGQSAVEKAGFNTKYSDYPGYAAEGRLYVIAAKAGDMENPWNAEPTSDIFMESGGSLTALNDKINTKYNEGSLVVTKDGNTIYFTRNNFLKRIGRDANKVVRLKLYRATREDNKWGNITALPFNSDAFSVGHPALNEAEDTLYFVSDMPTNNMGGTDIYSVALQGGDSYGEVTNIKELNTFGNEMFPFMAANGTLYYSSNGMQNNIGGLDIYRATMEDGSFKNITNMGEPINSPFDDFALVTTNAADDTAGKLDGYFASNRVGTESDDIFKFVGECVQEIAGIVKDKKTGDYLPNAIVSLIDSKNEIVDRMVADEFGQYRFMDQGCDNRVKFVRGEQQLYQTNEVALPEDPEKRKFLDIYLDRRKIDLVAGGDLADLLNPIYFDLDKSNIRPDAARELDQVVAYMKDRPTLEIDVRSHTDSRANDTYNIALSERRAKSTMDYIVKKGIDRSRLTGRGYGETQLVNKCSNGVPCSEAEHQRNRRSEFIIQ